MKRLALILVLACAGVLRLSQTPPADVVLLNGTVITVDTRDSIRLGEAGDGVHRRHAEGAGAAQERPARVGGREAVRGRQRRSARTAWMYDDWNMSSAERRGLGSR
jgi:hypothetical protein